jgi:tetratricopeptide (TPR) repeat protein
VQDYEIDPGYTLSAHLTFNRPTPSHVVSITSQGQNFDNEFFSLEQKGREDNGNYIVDIKLVVKAIRLTPQQYPRFYEQTRLLLNANEWMLAYRYDKNTADLAFLKENAVKTGKAENYIALAKLEIKNGDYAKALEAANKAIKAEPKNAEAYYILGLAQGYNNLLNESEKSFAKAEDLGFVI